MDKQIIKEVIKEMIESGELKIITEITKDYNTYDDFGNADGVLEDISVENYLEVEDEQNTYSIHK